MSQSTSTQYNPVRMGRTLALVLIATFSQCDEKDDAKKDKKHPLISNIYVNGNLYESYTYTNDNLSSVTRYGSSGPQFTLARDYDEDERLFSVSFVNATNQNVQSEYRYTYTDQGVLEKIETFYPKDGILQLSSTELLTFKNGDYSESQFTYVNSSIGSLSKMTYTYTTDGIHQHSFFNDGSTTEVIYKYYLDTELYEEKNDSRIPMFLKNKAIKSVEYPNNPSFNTFYDYEVLDGLVVKQTITSNTSVNVKTFEYLD